MLNMNPLFLHYANAFKSTMFVIGNVVWENVLISLNISGAHRVLLESTVTILDWIVPLTYQHYKHLSSKIKKTD